MVWLFWFGAGAVFGACVTIILHEVWPRYEQRRLNRRLAKGGRP